MTPLHVKIWDHEVGILMWDQRARNSYFTFDAGFLSLRLDISPLAAPVSGAGRLLPIYGLEGPVFNSLPPFIADSLPDAWGNELFEQWRRRQRRPQAEGVALEKLAFIGSRGMGALEYVPEIPREHHSGGINPGALYELSKRILNERERLTISPEEEPTMQSLLMLGSSIGGRFPKALVAIDEATGEMRSGQIDGPDSCRYYIVKFNNPERSTAEVEMAYHLMAREAGIAMMPCRLRNIEGIDHFFTERYDRINGQKLHVQTLSAMLPGADSYEAVVDVCRKLDLTHDEIGQVYRRMVFNILSNNTDDHSRNIAFTMDSAGIWNLAPAYDLTFIFDTGGFTPCPDHCLMMRGKRRGITLDDMLDFAEDAGLRSPRAYIDEVAEAVLTFPEKARDCGVEQHVAARIADAIRSNVDAISKTRHTFSFVSPAGTEVNDIRIEMAYKGNYHLYATINGQNRRRVITPRMPQYAALQSNGVSALSAEELQILVKELLLPGEVGEEAVGDA